MRRVTDWLRGYAAICVTGGTPQWCLNRLTAAKLPFWGLTADDAFTVRFITYERYADEAVRLAVKATCNAEVTARCGLRQSLAGMRRRTALLILTVFALLAAIIAPQFIWFFRVEGNSAVPTERILRAVRDAGVTAGVYGPSVKPQQVRYRVLAQLPELEWLTVTQNGAAAVVTVRERKPKPRGAEREVPRNMVAVRGGMITSVSALEGQAAVKTGDIVEAGTLLISGYADLGGRYRVCCADGEVFARTWRTIGAVTPSEHIKKSYTGAAWRAYYLQIGRNRLKLSFDSGNSTVPCDKMTVTRTLTLPGGLTLPISLATEIYRAYTPTPCAVDSEQATALLRETVENGVRAEMIAVRIVGCEPSGGTADGVYTMLEKLECEEMIARPIRAEIFKGD